MRLIPFQLAIHNCSEKVHFKLNILHFFVQNCFVSKHSHLQFFVWLDYLVKFKKYQLLFVSSLKLYSFGVGKSVNSGKQFYAVMQSKIETGLKKIIHKRKAF